MACPWPDITAEHEVRQDRFARKGHAHGTEYPGANGARSECHHCRACRGSIACRQTIPYPPAEPFCSGAAALAEGLWGTGPLGARRALFPRGSGTLGGGQCSAPFCRVELCATTRTCARIGIRAGNRGDGIMAGRGLAAECVRCSREHMGKTDVRKAGRYRNFTYNANR